MERGLAGFPGEGGPRPAPLASALRARLRELGWDGRARPAHCWRPSAPPRRRPTEAAPTPGGRDGPSPRLLDRTTFEARFQEVVRSAVHRPGSVGPPPEDDVDLRRLLLGVVAGLDERCGYDPMGPAS